MRLGWIIRFNRVLKKIELTLGCSFFVVIIITVLTDILKRKLLQQSVVFVEELTILLATWMIYLAAAYLFREGKLIRADFLLENLRLRLRFAVELGTYLLVGTFIVFLLIYGYRLQTYQSIYRSYTLDLPKNVFSLPVLYAAFSIGLSLIEQIYSKIMELLIGGQEGAR
jgi:TRAP-type C4-dicarboxylate transport system permease small subunit